jgi:hypothetical protein
MLKRKRPLISTNASSSNNKNVKKGFDIDYKKIALLSAIDSYHDFGNTDRTQSSLKTYIKNLLDNFLKENEVDVEFEKLTSNYNAMNKDVYDRYVIQDKDIYESQEYPLNTGKNLKGTTEDEHIDILDKILKFFQLTEDQVCIIRDRSSIAGCRKEFEGKFINSYASWFDNSACNKAIIVANDIKLEKETKNLFLIDAIEGSHDGKKAKGDVLYKNTKYPFGEAESVLRPEVSTYATYMNTENTIFDTHFKSLIGKNTDTKSLLLLDLKRSADGLQIASGMTPYTLGAKGTSIYPVFITGDTIAATIAVNKGVRTVLTKQDPSKVNGNPHSLKKAVFLVHKTLLDDDYIKELDKIALDDYKKNLTIRVEELKEEIKNTHREKLTELFEKLKEFLDADSKNVLKSFESFKVYYKSNYLKYLENNINYYKNKLDMEKNFKKDSTVKNKHIDYMIAIPGYTYIINLLNEPIIFPNEILKKIETIFKKYINLKTNYFSEIIKYAKHPDCPAKLSSLIHYSINLAYGYLYNDNIIDLLFHLYIPFFNMDKIITNASNSNKYTLGTMIQLANEGCLYDIFVFNTDKYTELITNEFIKENNIIISPIGVVFMDYLLTNETFINDKRRTVDIVTTVLKKKTAVDNLLKDHLVIINKHSTIERLIKYGHCTNHVNDLVNKYLYENPSQTNINLLTEFADKVFNQYLNFMAPFYYYKKPQAQPLFSNQEGGNTPPSRTSSLKKFMNLSFNEKIKHLIHSKDTQLLEKLYDTYYKTDKKQHSLRKELEYIQTINSIIIDDYKKSVPNSKNIGFELFKESLFLYPQLIDPSFAIELAYFNKLLKPNIELYNAIKNLQNPLAKKALLL